MNNDAAWDINRVVSEESTVEKFVFTKDTAVAESVLYAYPDYASRTVICCSTQSGCPVGCRFCGAGDYFVRNLTTEEIVAQPKHLLETIEKETGTKASDIEKLQIMFMSMGEPMLNMNRMIESITELYELYPNAALLVSSSGPKVNYEKFIDFAATIPTVGLQFSVHESTNEARDKLVPFKAKLTLEEIAEKGVEFFEKTGRNPFFNYCVHDRNASQEDVNRLKELFDPRIWQATISVICERDETLRAAHERQYELTTSFMSKMLEAGYSTRRFDPAGQSIGGGCGQLFYVQQWFKENSDKTKASVGNNLPSVHPSGSTAKNEPPMSEEFSKNFENPRTLINIYPKNNSDSSGSCCGGNCCV